MYEAANPTFGLIDASLLVGYDLTATGVQTGSIPSRGQALGHAQRLREIATMLRSTRDRFFADAAVQADEAAKFLEA